MSGSNCCFLSCVQISQEAGKVVWYYHHFKIFPEFVAIHRVKGFSIVNEADVFLEFFCFFCDPKDVGNLISGASASSKPILNIWKFSVHILRKPSLENFEHDLTSMWNECNCVVAWTFFGIALLWDWNENWPFSCPMATAEFSKFSGILSAALAQHHLLGFEILKLEFHHLH